jgi:predicted enzyme related to lactoylglutathione lyase
VNNLGTYFEIPVIDLKRAIVFYSFLFDCEFSTGKIHGLEMAFFPFSKDKQGITGALVKGKPYTPSKDGSLIYFSTSDIEKTLNRVIEKSGTVLFPRTLVPNLGYSAEFEDSEGNRIALFEVL